MKFYLKICVIILTLVALAGCGSKADLPRSVVIDAGAPLACDLLESPKTIESVTALYGCEAPGAYLSSIDTRTMTAQYFTTDSQSTTITYGPESKLIMKID